MQYTRFRIARLAPLALLGISPALVEAQQTMPPAGTGRADEANQTRELESEIEEYPGPNDGVRDEAASDTRIPEAIHSAPNAPSRSVRPQASAAKPAPASGGSAIDPAEVERVMGSDAAVVSLASLGRTSITRLQTRLHELGHYQGPIDGMVGPKTRAAIEAYARAQFTLKQRLIQQGQLTSDLARQLAVDGDRASEGGEPFLRDGANPSLRNDTPLLPPGGAPLPPPGIAPQPTPSSSPAPRQPGSTPAPRPVP